MLRALGGAIGGGKQRPWHSRDRSASIVGIVATHEQPITGDPPTMPTPDYAPQAFEVFISYAHRDEDFRQALETHLSLLRRQGHIAVWHDRNITGAPPGPRPSIRTCGRPRSSSY